MQDANILLTILSKMGQKPAVKFDKLYQKLYNTDLWLLAYERIAANPGNMTPGVDGETIDGFGMAWVHEMIDELKTSQYTPKPARRKYIPKPNGGKRPIGIPGFRDKLLQTVVSLILEAIYEPTFSNNSHGFRPERSCHTALEQVKRMIGVRWWVDADIRGFFDNLDHQTLLRILGKRITDQRFLHLIHQFLRVGYIDDWDYTQTYSGTPQGSTLSPVLSNIYLHELDQAMEAKIKEFNQGKTRRKRTEYQVVTVRKVAVKKRAKATGDWNEFHELTKQQLNMPASDPMDPNFKRLTYCRYADDFLIGVNGSKQDAQAIKAWLADFLNTALQLELSEDKTHITNAKDRVRFLGYDIKKWGGKRRLRFHTKRGAILKRTITQQLALLMPRDRVQRFVRKYGTPNQWHGEARPSLLPYSELEIMQIYNAEVRGFLNYYALANNLTFVARSILWMTTSSFLRTIADKRRSTLRKVARSMKHGPSDYAFDIEVAEGDVRKYRLFSSTRQLQRGKVDYSNPDPKPKTWKYRSRTELGQRLRAHTCEWCERDLAETVIEVHHVRKLKDLKGKTRWEQHMIARRRKTMVLCRRCHRKLHAGTLSEKDKAQVC